MTKILENERVRSSFSWIGRNDVDFFFCCQVFLLVNEDTIKRYKSALADEIEPVIAELIERAQQGLSALEKKEHTLQTKVISILKHICI